MLDKGLSHFSSYLSKWLPRGKVKRHSLQPASQAVRSRRLSPYLNEFYLHCRKLWWPLNWTNIWIESVIRHNTWQWNPGRSVANFCLFSQPFSIFLLLFLSFLFPFSGGKTFSDQTVCYVRKQGVLSGWEQDFPNISLSIPPKTYPTLISCKCIAVLYFILVSNLFPFVKVKVKLAHEPEDPFILRDFTSNSLKAGRHSK